MSQSDKRTRSILKSITWRVIGTLDTILLSYFFIGDIGPAFSIGITELITKTIFYYLHERLWNRLQFGRSSTSSSQLRSVIKSLSWRFLGTLDTIILAFIFSKSISIALSIGATELFTKLFFYYLHERGWALIKWGKKEVPV